MRSCQLVKLVGHLITKAQLDQALLALQAQCCLLLLLLCLKFFKGMLTPFRVKLANLAVRCTLKREALTVHGEALTLALLKRIELVGDRAQ